MITFVSAVAIAYALWVVLILRAAFGHHDPSVFLGVVYRPLDRPSGHEIERVRGPVDGPAARVDLDDAPPAVV